MLYVVVHFFYCYLLLKEVDDFLILARLRAKVGFPVRVGQAACVEHQIGIHWHTVFETKGFKQNRHGRFTAAHHALFHQIAQLVQVQVAGVDNLVGAVADRLQQLLFGINRLFKAGVPVR